MMKTEQINRLEKLFGRELSDEQKERLGRIASVLGLDDDDSMWEIIASMEYQRVYYEDLPKKIAAASQEIVQGFSVAAEKEMGRAQSLLAERVAEQAKKMSQRLNVEALLPMGLAAIICLLAYGCLTMWAGFRLGSGQGYSPEWLLRMPSGFLMAGLLMAGGVYLGIDAAKEYAEDGKGWKRKTLIVLAMLAPGGIFASLAL